MSFGLVLGAGGTAGEAFHRGVLRALHEVRLDPRQADVLVGTSAGSIVAATLRRHALAGSGAGLPEAPSAPPGRRLTPHPRTTLAVVRRPRQAFSAAMLLPGAPLGRRSTEVIAEGLHRRHGDEWPDAPLWVVAARRRGGGRVVFGADEAPVARVGDAVAASCAIPGYFAPVRIGGVDYVDGGVHSPTNADLLAGLGLDLVVVSSPMSTGAGLRPRADLPSRLVFRHYLREETWLLRRSGTRVVTLEPDRAALDAMGMNMMNGRRVDAVEDAAYALARRRLRDSAA